MQAENCHREHHPAGVPPAPPYSVVSTGKGLREIKLVLASSGQGSRARLWPYGRMECHVRLPVFQHWIFWSLNGFFAIPPFHSPSTALKQFSSMGVKGKPGKEVCLLSFSKPPEIISVQWLAVCKIFLTHTLLYESASDRWHLSCNESSHVFKPENNQKAAENHYRRLLRKGIRVHRMGEVFTQSSRQVHTIDKYIHSLLL